MITGDSFRRLWTAKQSPGARETCGSSKASLRLSEEDCPRKALLLVITLDFESVQKSCLVEMEAGFWPRQESMGIGSSFAPRSDQIFTIRYVSFWECDCLTLSLESGVSGSVFEIRMLTDWYLRPNIDVLHMFLVYAFLFALTSGAYVWLCMSQS